MTPSANCHAGTPALPTTATATSSLVGRLSTSSPILPSSAPSQHQTSPHPTAILSPGAPFAQQCTPLGQPIAPPSFQAGCELAREGALS